MCPLLHQNPYLWAALVGLLWVICIMLPVVIYQKTSPTNHLKRFPRQDQ